MQTKTFNRFMAAAAIYTAGLFSFSHYQVDQIPVPRAAAVAQVDAVEHASPDLEPRRSTVRSNPVIVRNIRAFNEEITPKAATQLATLIERTSKRHDVDPLLVTALISQESGFNADAVSPVGALGLGQLMPYTAADLGVDPHDPAENLEGSVRYLAQNLETWSESDDPVAFALASYNAGPGAVSKYGGLPPYEETQNYVHIITNRYDQLRAESVAGGDRDQQLG